MGTVTVADRFVDFDAAWSEQAASGAPRFRAFGRTFVLPTSPPVKLTLVAMRAAQGQDPTADVSPEKLLDLLGLLIGRDTVKTLLDEGATFGQLEDVMRFAQEAYRSFGDAEGDGDAVDPPVPQPPSSDIGGHSKPTSPGSTDWIS